MLSAQGPVRGQAPAEAAQAPLRAASRPSTPPVPENVDDYWFAPRPADVAAARNAALADAATAYARGQLRGGADRPRARPSRPAVRSTPTRSSTSGSSQLRQSHAAEADKAFDAVLARKPEGYLAVAAMIGKAEAAELRGDQAAAADLYEKLSTHKSVAPEDVLTRLARASLAAGDRKRAAEAFLRVYYEFPLTDAASSARDALGSLQDFIVRNTTSGISAAR